MKDSFAFSFTREGQEKGYWSSASCILLAVSGGVDSMVLLHLMMQVQKEAGFTLGVAHINHQLRQESLEEEAFLRNFCKEHCLPFFCTRWEQDETSGIEAAARRFRYQFFAKVMTEEGFDTLMTAHHQDDQAETLLMRLIRGADLKGHAGILPERAFASGRLIRPLLSFSKKMIRKFAQTEQIKYFEDTTNAAPKYLRNRMRLNILPELQKENPQTTEHLAQFAQQLQWADELIQKQVEILLNDIADISEESCQLDAGKISSLTDAELYYFWETFFQHTLEQYGVCAKQPQIFQLISLFKSRKAQWQMDFSDGWRIEKEYQHAVFHRKKKERSASFSRKEVASEGLYLSEGEWLAVFPSAEPCIIPEKVLSWSEYSEQMYLPVQTRFFVRKKQAGDRIQLTPTLTKRISRYFIDKKIPASIREKAWLLCNEQEEILALLPFAVSNLCKEEETDTIHYTLIYKKTHNMMK